MKNRKKRLWDAVRLYYGIAGELVFSDRDCTRMVYNHTLYLYIENLPDVFPPTKSGEYTAVYFVTGNPQNVSLIRRIAPQYGCFCYADNYGLGYVFTVLAPQGKA